MPHASRVTSTSVQDVLVLAIRALAVGATLLATTTPAAGQTRAARTPVDPWSASLTAARRAHAEGRHEEAGRLFAQADQAIGGLEGGGDTDEYDEDGVWIHAATRDPIRASFQCEWALSSLAAAAAFEADPDVNSRGMATLRAMASCDAARQAVAAALLGDEREAALRAPTGRFAAPFADRTPSAVTRAWASAVASGTFPAARGLDEAMLFVRAHAAATWNALDTTCLPAVGVPVTAAGQRLGVYGWDDDADYEELPPFTRAASEPPTSEPLARVHCRHDEAMTPYDMGLVAGFSREYVLTRDAAGVHVAAYFAGSMEWPCSNGVVQGLVAHREFTTPAGRRLHTFTFMDGARGEADDEDTFVTEETVVCDLVAHTCGGVFVSLEEVRHVHSGDDDVEPQTVRRSWRSELRFDADRVALTSAAGAPLALARLGGRGVTVADLLSAPRLDGRAEVLDASPAAATSVAIRAAPPATFACPYVVTDRDGRTNVRGGPSTREAVVGTIASGTAIHPLERRGRWFRVSAPTAGWVFGDNIAERCP